MVLYSEYDLTMNEQIDLFCTMNLSTNMRETKAEMEMKLDSPTALDEKRYEAIRRREVANGDTFIYALSAISTRLPAIRPIVPSLSVIWFLSAPAICRTMAAINIFTPSP